MSLLNKFSFLGFVLLVLSALLMNAHYHFVLVLLLTIAGLSMVVVGSASIVNQFSNIEARDNFPAHVGEFISSPFAVYSHRGESLSMIQQDVSLPFLSSL
jgi:membrane-bound ClpP family serine protease